ncbi:hypothetical protein JCM8097_003427, partial [Rhodosporidiobolus ruineniae]
MVPKQRPTAEKIMPSLLAIHAAGSPAKLTIVSADPNYSPPLPPKTVPTMLVREQQHTPNIE